MSCEWDLLCVDCNDNLGVSWNHGERRLLGLLAERDFLADFPRERFEKLDCFSVDTDGVDIAFFARHRGHTLRLIDEYGRLYGACGKFFACGACDKHVHCKLPEGHAGACSAVLPAAPKATP